MLPLQIRDVCIRSCESYRSYLREKEENDGYGGTSVMDVDDMVIDTKSGEVRFRVTKRIRTVNDLYLRIGRRRYLLDEIHDPSYDSDAGTVILYPDEAVIRELRASRLEDIKLVSDLKWLIDVTQSYYESYGQMIRYPDRLNDLYGREEFHLPKGRMPSEEQVAAVEGVVNDQLSYVWGAPGAGKTQFVLATAIMTCVSAGERVAVIAPTNSALEQVLRGLIASIRESDPEGRTIDLGKDILRLGAASKEFAEEFPFVCEDRERGKAIERRRIEISQLREELSATTDPDERRRTESLINWAVSKLSELEPFDPALKERTVRVIAMTPHRLMMRYSPDGSDGKLSLDADRIFLDEAGYTSMINTLPLFTFGVPISMLGDHMQLPPVCEIEFDDIRAGMIAGIGEGDCYPWYLSSLHSESMLSMSEEDMRKAFMDRERYRLFRTGQYDLTTSYRFGERLASLLDRYVYGDMGLKGNSGRELVLEVMDVEFTDRHERNNFAECEAIMKDVMDHGYGPGDFAVLTPYRHQVRMMSKLFGSDRYNVSTIHRSQGREWDAVYLSVVDNRVELGKDIELHLTSNIALETNLNTINTAISRAKRRLVIVCDVGFWSSREGELIGDLVSNGDCMSRFRHDPSEPILFRPRSDGGDTEQVPLYHNRVDPRVPKRIYAAFSRGDIKVSYNTVRIAYDYCESAMLPHEGMCIVDHIVRAYGHLRSGDYEDAEDELREMVRLHNRRC